MAYNDLNTIHNPATGTVAPASWGDQTRDNFEFLIDPPACTVHGTSAQTVSDNTEAALNAAAEDFDNNAMHSTVTNTSRITIQTAGRYLVAATISCPPTSAGVMGIGIGINGTNTGLGMTTNVNSSAGVAASVTAAFVLAVGDYVQALAFQDTTGSLDITLRGFTAVFITR